MFKDVNQNFWQLASIQGAALGLQGMIIGEQLAKQYGIGTAIISLCIGNLILWIIGLTMFSMTYKEQGNAKHAIENVLAYLGKPITIIVALILMFAFISWFPVQIFVMADFSDRALKEVLGWTSTVQLISTLVFAFVIIGISTLGIRAIKWFCTVSLPLIVAFIIYSLFVQNGSYPAIQWGISFQGTILAIVIVFPGIINIPTFFRHARSKADGIFGLTLMTIFVIAFQTATIWMQINTDQSPLFAPYSPQIGWTMNLHLILAFGAITTFCVNLVNIYFASAALEIVVPSFTDARGYTLIGLIGLLGLGVLKSGVFVNSIQTLTNNFIGSLGVVLLFGYLARNVITHRHRHYEKSINVICWVLGCFSSLYIFYKEEAIAPSFITGIIVPLLSFLIIIFIEETVWSIRKIRSQSFE